MNRIRTTAAAAWFLALASAAASVPALGGSVQTRDGRTHEGDVALTDGALIVRPPGSTGGGREQRVAWADVARVTFKSAPKPDRPVGTTDGGLPAGWKAQDVGGVGLPGSAVVNEKGVFTVKASGWGAWGPADSCHFVSRELDGDGQVIARVTKSGDDVAKMTAAVMVRESLAPDAPMAAAGLAATGHVRLTRRPITDHAPPRPGDAAGENAWVRLTRKGETFTAYRSRDGRHWEEVASRPVPMKATVLVGLAAWVGSNAITAEAAFDNVLVAPGDPDRTDFAAAAPAVAQGAVMKDGALLAGAVASVDGTNVVLARGGADATYPRATVARLLFAVPPAGFLAEQRPPGVLLANGDFVEGEVTAVGADPADKSKTAKSKVSVTSLLFGPQQFEPGKEAVAAVLGESAPAPANYEVRTADGSILRAQTVEVRADGVTADDKPVADVVEVRKLAT